MKNGISTTASQKGLYIGRTSSVSKTVDHQDLFLYEKDIVWSEFCLQLVNCLY